MDEEIKIRVVEAEDFPSIYAFVNALEEKVFNKATLKKAFHKNTTNPKHIYLIAESKGGPVGYVSCHTQLLLHHGGREIGEIQELYVHPSARKRGVGKHLFHALKEMALAKGIIQLEVTANHTRVSAHRFYREQGFFETHKKFTLMLL